MWRSALPYIITASLTFFVLIIKSLLTQLAIVCFIIRLLSWMPEQLPAAPSSVAGLASPVHRLHHPKPEEHALLCSALLDSGGKKEKKNPQGSCSWIDPVALH